MRILVTGASGFVGSLLIPELAARGHCVRAFGRDPERVHLALERTGGDGHIEVVRGDALTAVGLTQALEGVQVAYYLIHSMERPRDGALSFQEREQIAAESFGAAAAAAGPIRCRCAPPSW